MADLVRILINTPGSVSQQWIEDGTPVDPGDVTVDIARADGTVLAAGASTAGSGASARVFSLTTTHTALLDTLTVTWTSTLKGTLVSVVEVVGGFVFDIADARAMKPFDSTLNDGVTYRYSTEAIKAARIEVERALEHEIGFAMVPRYALETFDGDGGRAFMLGHPYVRSVRSATVDGTALSVDGLASLAFTATGRLYYPSGWTSGYSNIVVGYEHGLGSPPPRAKDVALALLKRALVGAPADDRATSMSTDEQTTTFYVPGQDEPFDVPAANRFVASQSMHTGLA